MATTTSKLENDPFNLARFLESQAENYRDALSEITAGRKRTHWMWYIFPQFDGLAFSETSRRFAIKSIDEANAYLNHPVLGSRLRECVEAAMKIEGKSVREIFGTPDDLKLCSSATLFAAVSPAGSAFELLIEKYYGGVRDDRTLQLLEKARQPR